MLQVLFHLWIALSTPAYLSFRNFLLHAETRLCCLSGTSEGTSGFSAGIDVRGAYARSLPQSTHDSAGSAASATPPRSGHGSKSLPSIAPEGNAKASNDSGPLGTSTSLLQVSSRGSTAGPSREASAYREGSTGGNSDAPQLAAKAFAGADLDENAEPLSVALQLKAAAAIAAELPEAAKTLEAKMQDISAKGQAQRLGDVPAAAQGLSSHNDGSDDRVPLEALTRPAGRISRSLMEPPAVPEEASQASALHEAGQPAGPELGMHPQSSFLGAVDDEPEPLSMSMKGGLASHRQPDALRKYTPDQQMQGVDEPEPLSMGMKGGSLRPSLAAVQPQESAADEPEPLSMTRRKPASRSTGNIAQQSAANEPEPLSMSRRKPSSRSMGSIAEEHNADAPEPLVSRKSQSKRPDYSLLSQNGPTDAGTESSIIPKETSQGFVSLFMSARQSSQPGMPGFMNGSPAVPSSGLPGQADKDREPSTDDEPEPLSMARKSSSGSTPKSVRAGTPRPTERSRPGGPYLNFVDHELIVL